MLSAQTGRVINRSHYTYYIVLVAAKCHMIVSSAQIKVHNYTTITQNQMLRMYVYTNIQPKPHHYSHNILKNYNYWQ